MSHGREDDMIYMEQGKAYAFPESIRSGLTVGYNELYTIETCLPVLANLAVSVRYSSSTERYIKPNGGLVLVGRQALDVLKAGPLISARYFSL